jgi:hypothetical protein
MAPAIVHFLVGSSLLLLVALIGVVRYRISTEHLLWVLPVGGVWGLAPDFHHIAPVATDALYAFHRSPWAEVFALHYTLDQPMIRALYHESIFAAIGVFSGVIAVVWGAIRYRTWREPGQSLQAHERRLLAGAAIVISAGVATVVFGVVLNVQLLLPSVAGVVGLTGMFAGWGVVIACGLGAAWLLAGTIELALTGPQVRNPTFGAGLGCLGGVGAWGVSLVVVPWLSGQGGVVIHWGGLFGLLAYGTVFGAVYTTLRGTVLPIEDISSPP